MDQKALIFDLDGVLTGSKDLQLFPETIPLLKKLSDAGIPSFVATNNSRNPPEKILSQFQREGFDLDPDSLITPFLILEEILSREEFSSMHVIGEKSLEKFVQDRLKVNRSGKPGVLVGFDSRFNSESIVEGLNRLKDGAQLFSMNSTVLIRGDHGHYFPGPASVAAMYRAAFHGNLPCRFLGKGDSEYDRLLFSKIPRKPEEITFVSDDPWTDLEHYAEKGLQTVFITTGKYGIGDLKGSPFQPDRIVDSLDEILI